ncbi:HAD-IIIA family hydrolase [Pricia sp. S334]|uniref:D,D-heptose 1,7-bisphosphate phosphatase n=1 Tax=Pricia mediterranea TaxID=3076079 RepID=A0ABU3L4F2_9FLAO|nr:HAD-IIIA family hydrolase [Pricia sp. S334]MDT7828084.1 HAD-IIIA family hydrolase [Pricia sp. S334]
MAAINKKYDTLFLDRDGVLNKKIDDGYVLKEEDIEILLGISEFLKFIRSQFSQILVVTNQRCIGLGLIDYNEVIKLNQSIDKKTGSFIDYFYVCPHLNEDNCVCRKPKTGLFFYALEDYPIDFQNSWMIGDSVTDIIPAKELGLRTILISSGSNPIADIHIESTKDLLGLPEWE